MWVDFFLRILLIASSSIAVVKSVQESADQRSHCQRALWGLRDQNHDAINGYYQNRYYHENRYYHGRRCTTAFLHTPRPRSIYVDSREKLNGALHRYAHDEDFNSDITENSPMKDPVPTRRKEWIDGKQMMQILAQEEEEEQRRKKVDELDQQLQDKSFQENDEQLQLEIDQSVCVSRISYTDANTLQIEIPPSGFDATTLASGAFSAIWFSAVAPATISMLSAGIVPALFMAPFWLAGGVVAKTAVYDPFVSSTLSIGKYLWTLEKKFFKRIGTLTKKDDGSTESLEGAVVELAMVVNNVGIYQLRLISDGKSSIAFGKGLAREELEYISRVINDHKEMLQES